MGPLKFVQRVRNIYLDAKRNHIALEWENSFRVRFLQVSKELYSFVSSYTLQIVLNRVVVGCKKTMRSEKKDTTNCEHPAKIKKPLNTLADSMPTYEFARIYYDGP